MNLAEKECDIYFCHDGEIELLVSDFRQPDFKRILAYKNDYLYYVTEPELNHFRYNRISRDGVIEVYPDIDYCVDYHDPFESTGSGITNYFSFPLSISDDGRIVFCDYRQPVPSDTYYDNYEYLSYTDMNIKIVDVDGGITIVGHGKSPAWLDNDRILFDHGGVLWLFNTITGSSSAYLDDAGSQIDIEVFESGCIAINPEKTHISYQRYKKNGPFEGVISSMQPIEIVSLKDNTRVFTERITLRDRIWFLLK